MKKFIAFVLSFLMTCSSSPLLSEDLSAYPKDTAEEYRTGNGAEDGAYTSLGLSMLGWGLGLALGIGILAAVLHQSKASTSHD